MAEVLDKIIEMLKGPPSTALHVGSKANRLARTGKERVSPKAGEIVPRCMHEGYQWREPEEPG